VRKLYVHIQNSTISSDALRFEFDKHKANAEASIFALRNSLAIANDDLAALKRRIEALEQTTATQSTLIEAQSSTIGLLVSRTKK